MNLFGKGKMPPPEPQFDIRDTWFGDLPRDRWPDDDTPAWSEPWRSFVTARNRLEDGHASEAVAAYQSILAMRGLESRHYLQAWHFLRDLGVQPDEATAKKVYGVIVEYPMEDGHDLVVAYADRTARYLNHTGALIVWDMSEPDMDLLIEALLAAGEKVVDQIGPWEGPPPPVPNPGELRINFLTPSGLHFGAGSIALANEPMARPVIFAAMQIMRALIAKVQPPE